MYVWQWQSPNVPMDAMIQNEFSRIISYLSDGSVETPTSYVSMAGGWFQSHASDTTNYLLKSRAM